MQVTIKLFATFRSGRFSSAAQEYPAGTRIADVISALQIPAKEVGVIMLNGQYAEPDQELDDGGQLAIFPLVGGG